MRANFPRAWLDVNREPYELDPKMFSGVLPPYANVRSVRVAGGLGTIARIVAESEEIYDRPLNVEECLARIDLVYKPYHQTLHHLMAATHAAFGVAVLIDCHSMPSTVRGGTGRLRPDFVVGDRYGASCSSELTDAAVHILSRLGYSVSRNKPYAGGYITEHYGRPSAGFHALQIEVKRCLYMDEQTLARTAGFDQISRRPVDLRQGPRLGPRRRAVRPARRGGIAAEKKRGRSFPRRPKSREETPKEGSGIATALQQLYGRGIKSREWMIFVAASLSHKPKPLADTGKRYRNHY